MALHFDAAEFSSRKARLLSKMHEQGLDAMLLFAQESMYWLTGYDTFGFCFFQCMIVEKSGAITLLTRSADLRQARHTSNVENIIIWADGADAHPTNDLALLLKEQNLSGATIGVEFNTQGLTGYYGLLVNSEIGAFAKLQDHSLMVPALRAIKSAAELTYVRKAGELADQAFLDATPLIKSGADEGDILAAMQGAVFAGGGDYAGNEFIIGSGADALLCRYKAGRRKLSHQDQLTLEWAGAYRRYHSAMMTTVIIGSPTPRHLHMQEAAIAALSAVEAAMISGNTFGDVFDAHAKALDEAGLNTHRLNACGYSLGARFTPSWMDMPMFYHGNPAIIAPNMSLFAHMIIVDSQSNTAITLGRTYITTQATPERLSKLSLDLVVS